MRRFCAWGSGGRPMPKGLKRYYGCGHLHFLTFSCHRRLPLLSTVWARNLFVDALGKMRERYQFLLVGYVVMPDHVHLLISEPAQGTPSTVLQALKQRVARDMRRANAPQSPTRKNDGWGTHRKDPMRKNDVWGTRPKNFTRDTDEWGTPEVSSSSARGELPRFWQPRFYDFNVHSAKKRREKIDYMHANPVKRGLVKDPSKWIWSSWSFYAKGEAGLVPVDPVE